MRKIISILLIVISLTLFGCKKENYNKIKIILPSGTPLVAVGGIMDDENYDFEVVSGADLLTTALAKNDYDVVIAPVTAATKLHLLEKTNFKFASVITTGNNYLVRNGAYNLPDVVGRKILAYGQNNTPDIILKAALEQKGLEAVIEYQTSVSDVVPFILQENSGYDYFLTAEPTLTQLKVKYNLDLKVIDLQEALKEEIAMIPQAGIFVLPKADNQKEIARFLQLVEKNIKYLNENSDKYYEKVSSLNEFFTKLGEEVLEKSIANSNIKYYKAKDNLETMNKYYALLNKYNDKLLNGKVPGEDFYY